MTGSMWCELTNDCLVLENLTAFASVGNFSIAMLECKTIRPNARREIPSEGDEFANLCVDWSIHVSIGKRHESTQECGVDHVNHV